MSDARLLDAAERWDGDRAQGAAQDVARRLPSLIVAAKEVAASVMHGMHGRRRAGIGENFWQFRPFVAGEPAGNVDWRRSARDDRLYVREREWESAHTVFVWIDRSASMAFISKLALQSKFDRAIVLGLAAADLLVRGGERVGLLGLMRPIAMRNVIDRFAEAMISEESVSSFKASELPPTAALQSRTQLIWISDFLSDLAEIDDKIARLAAGGARGHLVMIADPIEETFPFSGHTEFLDVDSQARLRVGRAEAFKEEYMLRLGAHRDAVRESAAKRGWTLLLHRTDRPASEALLALRMRLEVGTDLQGARFAG
ncbi:DUF58 domain-containing protein [Methylovirgula sp. HY1]|uniref:DUF58 domain-containing protein n=1 Tax=Methylovirgula sp. HY1 TaxID=2822761 RepID=UPI001C5A74DB|nr:DUF58 domain-containing protein [Methylovirgula sp. HY1]QXX73312.1 hypothetical protein MHY1_00107 [Methylovirgula sp. HY1]